DTSNITPTDDAATRLPILSKSDARQFIRILPTDLSTSPQERGREKSPEGTGYETTCVFVHLVDGSRGRCCCKRAGHLRGSCRWHAIPGDSQYCSAVSASDRISNSRTESLFATNCYRVPILSADVLHTGNELCHRAASQELVEPVW